MGSGKCCKRHPGTVLCRSEEGECEDRHASSLPEASRSFSSHAAKAKVLNDLRGPACLAYCCPCPASTNFLRYSGHCTQKCQAISPRAFTRAVPIGGNPLPIATCTALDSVRTSLVTQLTIDPFSPHPFQFCPCFLFLHGTHHHPEADMLACLFC